MSREDRLGKTGELKRQMWEGGCKETMISKSKDKMDERVLRIEEECGERVRQREVEKQKRGRPRSRSKNCEKKDIVMMSLTKVNAQKRVDWKN